MKNLLVASGLLFSTLSFAASPGDAERAANELFTTMNMVQVQDQTIVSTVEMLAQRQPAIAKHRPETMAFFRKHLSWKALEPQITAMYIEAFTAQELREMAAFYKTPVGKKTLTVLPSLTAKGTQLGIDVVQREMPAFMKSIEDKPKK